MNEKVENKPKSVLNVDITDLDHWLNEHSEDEVLDILGLKKSDFIGFEGIEMDDDLIRVAVKNVDSILDIEPDWFDKIKNSNGFNDYEFEGLRPDDGKPFAIVFYFSFPQKTITIGGNQITYNDFNKEVIK